MLFEEEERVAIKIRIKPSILDLAKDLYKKAYPFSSDFRLDDLFEEMITKLALDPKKTPKLVTTLDKTDSGNGDTLDINELLRG